MKQLPGMDKFVIDWHFMKDWPAALWAVFLSMIALIGAFLVILINHYRQANVVREYAIWGVLLFAYFYIRSRSCDEVHIHHYTLSMIVLSFTGYQSAFVTAICGIFNGIMIEGASFWGYDPVFQHDKHPKPNPHKLQARKALDISRIKIENQRLT
jgi:hypothetical protein